jgi:hypothetical protein
LALEPLGCRISCAMNISEKATGRFANRPYKGEHQQSGRILFTSSFQSVP